MGKEIERFVLDFDKLAEWKDSEGFPPCSCLKVYQAAGIVESIERYCKQNAVDQIAAVEVLHCNSYTLQKLRNFIKEIWENYDLDIKENNKVIWKHNSERKFNYPHKLKDKILHSINMDYGEYCPGLDTSDENLEDGTIVFRIEDSEPEKELDNEVIDA